MIEDRHDGTYEVSCDYCTEDREVEAEDWQDLMRELRSDGWKSRKIGEEWKHMCPDCFNKRRQW